MKIIHKLALLILLGFLSNLIISIVGLHQLSTTNQDLQEVMDNTLPSVALLSQIDHDFMDARLAIREHVMAVDIEKKKIQEQRFATDVNRMRTQLDKYAATLISDETDRNYFQQAHQHIDAYIQGTAEIFKFSNENNFSAAMDSIAKYSEVAANAAHMLTTDEDYNAKLAEDQNRQADANYDSARWLLLGTTLGMTLALALIGWLIYRQLNQGLHSAHTTISRIENSLDFTLRADVHGQDEISSMLRAFNQLISRIQTNLIELLAGVDRVIRTTDRLHASARRVSEGSSTQSASTSHMAASVEEMTVSINHVADQAANTSEQANEAGRRAEAGQSVIAHTVDNIHAIADAVDSAAQDIKQLEDKGREIESVINIIRTVADQTNLLALNAAIEAARAGEQGRGFAVVADEVRSLAARTATSTKEIGDIIKAIQDVSGSAVLRMNEATHKVAQGVEGASQANETMAEICQVSNQAVSLVGDISNAIREQGAATNSIAQQVESVAEMVSTNTAAAEETAQLSDELHHISTEMKQIVAAYHL